MEENKTGVWIKIRNGEKLKYDHDWMEPFGVGDIIEVDNDDVYVRFKIEVVELKGVSKIFATYTIKPLLRIDRTTPFYSVTKFRDAEPIEMDVYANNEALIIVPFWYGKEQYRNQNIRSTEAVIAITRKESLRTTNEDLEIKTGTILADKIKVGISNRFLPALTQIDWNGEMSATLTFSPEKIDEIMNKLTGNEEEKDMNIKNLKEMIKRPIYVDKEITVKEPMLDNNGKQIEKDGEPVFKVKHYHGMVKILWTSGAETVAYVEGNDVYDRENGFKTCVLKYLCGNAGAYDAVDFWTNKYVKYPSSCIEVTENLCKLEKILEKDKYRKDDQKGLPHAKFLRRIGLLSGGSVAGKLIYKNCDMKYVNEFKKLAKKYFPELQGKEIYVNGNKNDEIFVAIK